MTQTQDQELIQEPCSSHSGEFLKKVPESQEITCIFYLLLCSISACVCVCTCVGGAGVEQCVCVRDELKLAVQVG